MTFFCSPTHNPTYRLSLWSEDLLHLIICFQGWRIISRQRMSISSDRMLICEQNTASCQLRLKLLASRNKAVAEGGIIFQLDHSVSSRVARYTYGINVSTIFNPSLADHLARGDTSFENSAGQIRVPNYFSAILKKVDFTLIYATYQLIVNRIPRFQRKWSSGNPIAATFPSLNLMLWKRFQTRLNVIETVGKTLLIGSI